VHDGGRIPDRLHRLIRGGKLAPVCFPIHDRSSCLLGKLRPLLKSPTCHSEGVERPKNLVNSRKKEILRSAQDDKMALGRALNLA
jgi:hypothetical protein